MNTCTRTHRLGRLRRTGRRHAKARVSNREGLRHKRRPHKVINIILVDEIPGVKPEKGSNPRVHRGILAGTARRRKTAYHNILILFLVIQQSTHWNPRRPYSSSTFLYRRRSAACRLPSACQPSPFEDAVAGERGEDYTRVVDGHRRDQTEYCIGLTPERKGA